MSTKLESLVRINFPSIEQDPKSLGKISVIKDKGSFQRGFSIYTLHSRMGPRRTKRTRALSAFLMEEFEEEFNEQVMSPVGLDIPRGIEFSFLWWEMCENVSL